MISSLVSILEISCPDKSIHNVIVNSQNCGRRVDELGEKKDLDFETLWKTGLQNIKQVSATQKKDQRSDSIPIPASPGSVYSMVGVTRN